MYIHLGKDVIIRISDVIGIFDIEKTSISKYTKEFLKISQNNDIIFDISYDIPKSFIICRYNNKDVVYISQISPSVLKKRSNIIII